MNKLFAHHNLGKRKFRLSGIRFFVPLCGAIIWIGILQTPLSISTVSAASDSVVGIPTISAQQADDIFKRNGSPMAGTGNTIYAAARQFHIDDAFALAVWDVETNDGEAGVGRAPLRNPGGVKFAPGYPSGSGSYTAYPSYAAAEQSWFEIMESRYIHAGFTAVSTIAHPYTGTSSAPLWAGKVDRLISTYHTRYPIPTTQQLFKSLSSIPFSGVGITNRPITTDAIAEVAPLQNAQQKAIQNSLGAAGWIALIVVIMASVLAAYHPGKPDRSQQG